MNIISLFLTTVFTTKLNNEKDTILESKSIMLKDITDFYFEGIDDKSCFKGATQISIDYQSNPSTKIEVVQLLGYIKITLSGLPKGFTINPSTESACGGVGIFDKFESAVFYCNYKANSVVNFNGNDSVEHITKNEEMFTKE